MKLQISGSWLVSKMKIYAHSYPYCKNKDEYLKNQALLCSFVTFFLQYSFVIFKTLNSNQIFHLLAGLVQILKDSSTTI